MILEGYTCNLVSGLSVIILTSCGKNAFVSDTATEQTPAEDNKTDEGSNHMTIILDKDTDKWVY